MEAEVETSKPEGREIETKENMEEGGDGQEPKNWDMVVELVQLESRDGFLVEEAAWQAFVLIPKGGGDYHSIGLVEVIWKGVLVVLNCYFTTSITYRDSLHGFRAGHSTGTSTLEVKLIQQVSKLREALLYAIFLDPHKAYNALDRYMCLDILEVYCVGPSSLRLLCRYW